MHRRSPRRVAWPARLLWLPLLAAGLPLMMHVSIASDEVRRQTWRVLVSVPAPAAWVDHPATFWPGLALVAGAVAALALGQARRLPAVMYPHLAAAAWVFFAIAVLSTWRLEGFVAQVGQGVDWRFLAHVRTTWPDRVLLALSLAAGVACWLASWGPYRAPPDAQRDQGQRQGQ